MEQPQEQPQPPPHLFYRRLVQILVYGFCALLALWAIVSVTVEVFFPQYRPSPKRSTTAEQAPPPPS